MNASSAGDAPARVRFAWTTPEMRRASLAEAADTARRAHTAVVFAWSGQDELIEAVAAANPRTIVVLHTSGPVDMPWKDRVRAILEMWYPGQEGGWATVRLLLGMAAPSGKLPVTFPRKLDDSPGPVYEEGIAVGYRWHDRNNIEPLFAFGHGLSYSTFEYSDLAVNGSDVSHSRCGTPDREPARRWRKCTSVRRRTPLCRCRPKLSPASSALNWRRAAANV